MVALKPRRSHRPSPALLVARVCLLGALAGCTPPPFHARSSLRESASSPPVPGPSIQPPDASLTQLDDSRQVIAYGARGVSHPTPVGSSYPVLFYTYDPLVVQTGTPSPIALTLETDGTVTSVSADLQAGGTVTASQLSPTRFRLDFTSEQLLYNYAMGYLHNFYGYLNVYVGATLALRLNLAVNVSDSTVPPLSGLNLGPDALAGPHVVNLYSPGATPGSYDSAITHRFYEVFPDRFDFLGLVYADSTIANRTHMVTQNAVQGIGLSQFDNSAAFGSAGRLMGITNFPINQFFDGAESGFQHELGHQWVNYALSVGSPHWPISDLAQGLMGLSIPGSGGVGGYFPFELSPNGDGNYTLHYNPDLLWQVGFTDLDLYLMGLRSGAEVAPGLVFSNQDQASQLHDGGVLVGPTYLVDADTIASTWGPRVPDNANSPHQFTVASIVVTRDHLMSAEELAFFDHMAARASSTCTVPYSLGLVRGTATPFFLTTHTTGSIVSRILNQVHIPVVLR